MTTTRRATTDRLWIVADPLNIAERLARARSSKVVGRPAYAALKLMGVELPRSVVAVNLRLPHGAVGLVVHPSTVLGEGVKLYQGVTLGRSDTHLPPERTRDGGRIVVGDRVLIGANSVVLFRSGHVLRIGDDAIIGAGSVVTRDIPAGEVWAGNPAQRVGHNDAHDDREGTARTLD